MRNGEKRPSTAAKDRLKEAFVRIPANGHSSNDNILRKSSTMATAEIEQDIPMKAYERLQTAPRRPKGLLLWRVRPSLGSKTDPEPLPNRSSWRKSGEATAKVSVQNTTALGDSRPPP